MNTKPYQWDNKRIRSQKLISMYIYSVCSVLPVELQVFPSLYCPSCIILQSELCLRCWSSEIMIMLLHTNPNPKRETPPDSVNTRPIKVSDIFQPISLICFTAAFSFQQQLKGAVVLFLSLLDHWTVHVFVFYQGWRANSWGACSLRQGEQNGQPDESPPTGHWKDYTVKVPHHWVQFSDAVYFIQLMWCTGNYVKAVVDTVSEPWCLYRSYRPTYTVCHILCPFILR